MGKTSYSISVIGKDENPLESQGPSKDRDELPRKAVTMQVNCAVQLTLKLFRNKNFIRL